MRGPIPWIMTPGQMNETNKTLDYLISLNEVDALIVETREKLLLYPQRIRKMKGEGARQEKKCDDACERYDRAHQQRRIAEKEVFALRDEIDREQAKLMEVKSNKEYNAVLQEIASARERIDEWEMTGLEQLELEEKADLERDGEKGILDRMRSEQAAEESRLDGLIAEKRERLHNLEEERIQRVGIIDGVWIDEYELLMERYPGTVVVEIENDHCSGCNWKLVASTIQRVHLNRNVVRCEHCKRVLYLKS